MTSAYSEKDENVEFWFNLKKMAVEVGLKSAASYRVGPFKTREEAANALKQISERSASWSKDDESGA